MDEIIIYTMFLISQLNRLKIKSIIMRLFLKKERMEWIPSKAALAPKNPRSRHKN